MTALTRIIAGVAILAGLALLMQIDPLKVAMGLLSLLLFGVLLSLLWAVVIFYNWYNMERYDKRDRD